MRAPHGAPTKRVAELASGDETFDYGLVTHREGRKVWFEHTIVTFPTEDLTVAVTPESVTER